jgi:hypothetical protein
VAYPPPKWWCGAAKETEAGEHGGSLGQKLLPLTDGIGKHKPQCLQVEQNNEKET